MQGSASVWCTPVITAAVSSSSVASIPLPDDTRMAFVSLDPPVAYTAAAAAAALSLVSRIRFDMSSTAVSDRNAIPFCSSVMREARDYSVSRHDGTACTRNGVATAAGNQENEKVSCWVNRTCTGLSFTSSFAATLGKHSLLYLLLRQGSFDASDHASLRSLPSCPLAA